MNRALLVIDVQNEYFSGKLPVTHPPNSLDNILRAMEAAAANGVAVAVIRHAAKAASSPVFKKGSPEWELHPAVGKLHRDVLIEKTGRTASPKRTCRNGSTAGTSIRSPCAGT